MKKIYFLGGLPRSGNTLLSALLNQNPDIYVSPLSPLLDNLIWMQKSLNINEPTLAVNFEINSDSALKNYVQGFYNHIEKPFVIDRNKAWGSKQSIFSAYKYITEQPKVIYTVRDIPNILTSFLSLLGDDQNNFIDNSIRSLNIKPYGKQIQNDLRCDWLINNQIGAGLANLTELLQIGVAVCLIEYDELVKNPQKQLNKIYDFLELKHYANDFNNVKKVERENLSNVGLPLNLHNVRKKVEKISLDPKLILTPNSLNKYSGLEFWRK